MLQKQSVLAALALMALLALACQAGLARADDSNGAADEDDDTNEELQRGGGVANIFHNDVHDKGVPMLVEPQKRDCRSMPSKKRCETCCGETGRAYIWSRDVQLLRMRLRGCTCSSRVPKAEK